MKVSLLKVIVFLGSFLIFQIELILGKVLLPGFGGGYLVWGIAMVLFQGLLFLGYLYVHVCNHIFRFDKFKKVQIGLFLVSLLLFPLNYEPLKAPSYQFPPAVEIVLLLALAIGLPFLILSSISVYLQVQLSRSDLLEKENPYLLYSASNFGAFVALLTYPLIVEPALDQHSQFFVWEVIYFFLAGLFIWAQRAIPILNYDKEEVVKLDTGKNPVIRWLLLSGGGAALFLAVTNELTLNLAPVPLLWVLPLGIYLLTLALAFKQKPFCPSIIRKSFHLSVSLIVLLFLFKVTGNSPLEYLVMILIGLKIPWYGVALMVEPLLLLLSCFVICLVCHDRLNQIRPANPGTLTHFYLVISVGGFLGGGLVNWIAPVIFNTTVELPIACSLAILAFADIKSFRMKIFFPLVIVILGMVMLWPFTNLLFSLLAEKLAAIIILAVLYLLFTVLREKYLEFGLIISVLVLLVPFLHHLNTDKSVLLKKRNHYGIYEVYDKASLRFMRHGTILHGIQHQSPDLQQEALTYFHVSSPIGEILAEDPFQFSKVAVVGLGVGTLAAYLKESSQYKFFELDPIVGEIALNYFTFISRSRGKVDIVYGDGRVSLRSEPAEKYDAIVVDVFNSGSIPVHMATVDAIQDYQRVLKPEGVIFFHVSNLYIDLIPVLHANSIYLKLHSRWKEAQFQKPPAIESSTWVAITAESSRDEILKTQFNWKAMQVSKEIAPWTDNYSSIFSALKM